MWRDRWKIAVRRAGEVLRAHEPEEQQMKQQADRRLKVYISGKITGTNDYMERFQAAEDYLAGQGYAVINPAKVCASLPVPETSYDEYMVVAFALLRQADAIYMLEGFPESSGAYLEYEYANTIGKKVMYQ